MRFRDDTRGVTVQIGAVLFFATVIVALSLYQATVVPSQNADVEYRHSQTVQGDLADVRNSILETAASGNAQTASVTLGTQYPSRVFLMNPPPATGTLSTGQYENNVINVSNVEAAEPETADYIDGNWSAPTKYLSYEPNYNEYDDAPDRIYEASFLYNHYDDANVPLTDQLLVDGDTITLVALNGSTSTSQSGAVSVSAKPASAPYQSVQVEPQNASERINISIPTRLSAGQIRNSTSLDDQAGVTVSNGSQNQVVVSLPPGIYTLQTARVDVGSQTADPGAHYLTREENDTDSITLEVRDKFNNPVSGVPVEVTVGESVVSGDSNRTTDPNGQVTFQAEENESGDVEFQILDGVQDRERVSITLTGSVVGGGNGSTTNLEWNTTRINSTNSGMGMTCWEGNTTCEYPHVGTGPESVSLFAEFQDGRSFANVDFATNNTTVVSDLSPTVNESNSDGAVSTTGTVSSRGTALVYASGTNTEDTLTLRAVSPTDGGNQASNVEIAQTQINNGQVVLQFRNNNQQSVTFTRARLVSYTEANAPSNPNQEPIDRVVYRPGVGGPELVEGDSLEGVGGPTISNGGNQDVTLQPQRIDSRGGAADPVAADAQTGDSFELTIQLSDGSTRTYTVTL